MQLSFWQSVQKFHYQSLSMMMKGLKTAAIVVLCLFCISIGALADDIVKEITAQLRPDFTIEIDGEVKTFANVNGERVYPILYENTTYLPVRAIGNIMGKEVQWDQASRKVILKEKTNTTQTEDPVMSAVNSYVAAVAAADFDKAAQFRSDNAGFLEIKTELDRDFDNGIFANHKDEAWKVVFAVLNKATQTVKFEPVSMFQEGNGYKVSGKITMMDTDKLGEQFDTLTSDEKLSEKTAEWLRTGKLSQNSTETEILNVVVPYIVDEMVKKINSTDIPLTTFTTEYKVISKDGKWVIDMSGENPLDKLFSFFE